MACLLIPCICHSARGVDQGTTGDICYETDSSFLANNQSKATLLSKTTLARKPREFYCAATGLAADSAILTRV